MLDFFKALVAALKKMIAAIQELLAALGIEIETGAIGDLLG